MKPAPHDDLLRQLRALPAADRRRLLAEAARDEDPPAIGTLRLTVSRGEPVVVTDAAGERRTVGPGEHVDLRPTPVDAPPGSALITRDALRSVLLARLSVDRGGAAVAVSLDGLALGRAAGGDPEALVLGGGGPAERAAWRALRRDAPLEVAAGRDATLVVLGRGLRLDVEGLVRGLATPTAPARGASR
jgi:hypothetical protein